MVAPGGGRRLSQTAVPQTIGDVTDDPTTRIKANDEAHQAAVNIHSGFGTVEDIRTLVAACEANPGDPDFDLDGARERLMQAAEEGNEDAQASIQAEIAKATGDSHTWQSAIKVGLETLQPADSDLWEWALDNGHANLAAASRHTPFRRLVQLATMRGPAARTAHKTLQRGGGQGIDVEAWQLAAELAEGGSSFEETWTVLDSLYGIDEEP